MSQLLYRIRNKKTGKYCAGGYRFTKEGKFFDARTLKLHFDRFLDYDINPQTYKRTFRARRNFAGYPYDNTKYEIVPFEIQEKTPLDIQLYLDTLIELRNQKDGS